MGKRLTAGLAALLWVGIAATAFSAEIPPKPQGYVNDYAQLLSPAARSGLEAKLEAFEKATSNQVLVAIFPSLDGGSLEDFSIRLAEQWKIGTDKNDNGIILLIFKNDRKMRIEVGYGLEGALPDATAFQIIENEIVPRFRSGDFDGGVEAGIDSILAATRGEYTAASTTKHPLERAKGLVFFGIILFFVAPFILYIAILFFCITTMGAMGAVAAIVIIIVIEVLRRLAFSSVVRDYSRGGGGILGGGGFGGGSGGFGGGFGGGGGGSFGGGGASGSW